MMKFAEIPLQKSLALCQGISVIYSKVSVKVNCKMMKYLPMNIAENSPINKQIHNRKREKGRGREQGRERRREGGRMQQLKTLHMAIVQSVKNLTK